MGYFASLARQSGFSPAAKPATQRGLEVHLTRPAQPAPATPPHPVAAPQPVPASPTRVGLAAHRLQLSPQAAVHEYVVHTPAALDAPQSATSAQPPRATAPGAEGTPPPAVRIAAADAGPAHADRRLPTLADVQEWVSRPLVDAAAHDTEPGPAPPHTGRADRVPPAAMPEAGGTGDFTLEIGTIQIVVDQPPTLTQPVAAQRPSAPTTSGLRDPSRYYLR